MKCNECYLFQSRVDLHGTTYKAWDKYLRKHARESVIDLVQLNIDDYREVSGQYISIGEMDCANRCNLFKVRLGAE